MRSESVGPAHSQGVGIHKGLTIRRGDPLLRKNRMAKEEPPSLLLSQRWFMEATSDHLRAWEKRIISDPIPPRTSESESALDKVGGRHVCVKEEGALVHRIFIL